MRERLRNKCCEETKGIGCRLQLLGSGNFANTITAMILEPAKFTWIRSTCASVIFAVAISQAGAQQGPPGLSFLPQVVAPTQVESRDIVTFQPETAVPPHRFFDRTNVWLFSGIAISRALDYTSTRNMLARGREEELIPDDVVYNTAGFVSLEAAGTATSVGVSYLLHRTGHHKLERWMSIGHISVTAFGAARNYALKSKHS